jgi:hypothetical protein
VITPETSGHRPCVERASGADDVQPVRELGSVTQRAVQFGADSALAAGGRRHPRAVEERRAVPDMLAVQAFQLRDPVAVGILVEAGDRANQDENLSMGSRYYSSGALEVDPAE